MENIKIAIKNLSVSKQLIFAVLFYCTKTPASGEEMEKIFVKNKK
jgi:hypothetical protein